MQRIDFNCDLGEGFGEDAAIVSQISSASIACGGHAGDERSMRETVTLCLQHGVAIGAHPSFEDRVHFGRYEFALPTDQIRAQVTRQIERFADVCTQQSAPLRHVKPHGALYNLAARDRSTADAIAAAVHDFDPALQLFGLSGSQLTAAGEAAGLRVVHEVFAERAYDADGQLAPRGSPGAVIDGLDGSLAQVRRLLREGAVVARDGSRLPLRADTLCLHGDRADAAQFARALRAALEDEGIEIGAPQ